MISLAQQNGSYVYVYDENGNTKFSMPADEGSLIGFTGTTVSIRRGSYVYVYDENGNTKFTKPI